MSLQELPFLGALRFRLISEEFFACIASPNIWGKGWSGIYHSHWPKDQSGSCTHVVLVIDSIREGDVRLVMTFCHNDQAKVEASDTILAVCQWDLSELSMVVVRRYTDMPYIPKGTSQPLYLDVSMLQWGTSSTQFPLSQL